MIATLIIYPEPAEEIGGATGRVCNVMRGKIKPAQNKGQKVEFVHMVVDFPTDVLDDIDKDKYRVELSRVLTRKHRAIVADRKKDIPFVNKGDKITVDCLRDVPEKYWKKDPEPIEDEKI